MTSVRGDPLRPLPRPISSGPVDALLAHVDDLAKAWLLALLEQRPLEEAPNIPTAELVRDGPVLCGAVLRALADDRELPRLEPGGALEQLASRAGELAGASRAESSARAVEALRRVIWSAVRAELGRPDADEVAGLAERLALVTELVRAAVLRRFGAAPAAGIDLSAAIAYGGAKEALDGHGPRAMKIAAAPSADGMTPMAADSLWRGALEEEVVRAKRSGAKLALLLAELGEPDHASVSEPAHVASETFGRFAQAVRSALRREDIMSCETENRAWVIGRTTGRAGARALGARIAHAVQGTEQGRGAPPTVGIGIAILGEDAHDAVGLIAAAGEWTFAALSAGSGEEEEADPPGDDGPSGDADGPRLAG